jgi:hypothetical protein
MMPKVDDEGFKVPASLQSVYALRYDSAKATFGQSKKRRDFIRSQNPRRSSFVEGVKDYLVSAQNVKIAELEERLAFLETILFGFTRADEDIEGQPNTSEPSEPTLPTVRRIEL